MGDETRIVLYFVTLQQFDRDTKNCKIAHVWKKPLDFKMLKCQRSQVMSSQDSHTQTKHSLWPPFFSCIPRKFSTTSVYDLNPTQPPTTKATPTPLNHPQFLLELSSKKNLSRAIQTGTHPFPNMKGWCTLYLDVPGTQELSKWLVNAL